jgi:hypothetical protein
MRSQKQQIILLNTVLFTKLTKHERNSVFDTRKVWTLSRNSLKQCFSNYMTRHKTKPRENRKCAKPFNDLFLIWSESILGRVDNIENKNE